MNPTSSSSSSTWLSSASYQPPSESKHKNPNFIQLPDVVLARVLEFIPSILPVLHKARLLTNNSSYSFSKLTHLINGYLKGTESKHINVVPKFESVKQLRTFLETYGKNVRFLDLSFYESLNDNDVSELLTLAPSVEELKLSGSRITGSFLESKEFSQLKRLNLYNCYRLTDENLNRLNAPHLEELNLNYAFGLVDSLNIPISITGSFLEGKTFSQLKRLNLYNCYRLTDENLGRLNAPHLEELNLGYAFGLVDSHNIPISITGTFLEGKAFSQLKKFILNGCNQLSDESLRHLNTSRLEELNCSYMNITGSFSENKAFSKLKKLTLLECPQIKDEYLSHLNTSCLEELSVSFLPITGSFLEGKVFLQLKRLSIVGHFLEENLKHLNAPSLERVKLFGTSTTGSFLEGKAFSKLRKLELRACTELSEEHLKHLNASYLKSLRLVDTPITGSFLEGKVFPQLRKLSVGECKSHEDCCPCSLIDYASKSLNAPRLEVLELYRDYRSSLFMGMTAFSELKSLACEYAGEEPLNAPLRD